MAFGIHGVGGCWCSINSLFQSKRQNPDIENGFIIYTADIHIVLVQILVIFEYRHDVYCCESN